jgi:hypothetical protein
MDGCRPKRGGREGGGGGAYLAQVPGFYHHVLAPLLPLKSGEEEGGGEGGKRVSVRDKERKGRENTQS